MRVLRSNCITPKMNILDNFAGVQLVPSTLHFRRGHVVDNCLSLLARGPHCFELGFLQLRVQAIAPWNRQIGKGLDWISERKSEIAK